MSHIRNAKTTVTKEQHDRHRRILTALLKQEENRRCCDCGSRGPTWASINLGVFMCLQCSGIHRSLGVHISKVRSATLDTWLPEQVEFVQQMGNKTGNEFWEARLPPNFRRPAEQDTMGLNHFIREKYVDRRYCSKDYKEPPTIENYRSHPFMAEGGSQPAEVAQQPAAQPQQRVATPPRRPPSVQGQAHHQRNTSTSSAPQPSAPIASFDLLSLDDPHPTPSAPVAADDAWAAFEAAPAATAAAPQTVTAAATVTDEWDAFAEAPAASEGGPATGAPAGPPADPFALAELISANPEPAQNGVTAAVTTTPAANSKATKSVDDILKLYNTPQQNTFAAVPQAAAATNAMPGMPQMAGGMAQPVVQGMAPPVVQQGVQAYMYMQHPSGAVFMVPSAAAMPQGSMPVMGGIGALSAMGSVGAVHHAASAPNLGINGVSTVPSPRKPDPLDSIFQL